MRDQVSVITDGSGRLRIILDAPKGNSLTIALIERLREAVKAAGQDPHLKVITFETAGAHFSFGSSIEEHLPEAIERALPPFHALLQQLLEVDAVTAAVVRGRCLGGGFELVLACDLIFAAEDAMFGLPEILLGVFPPAGSVLLPPRVGASRAATAILTGEAVSAEAWRHAGLVTLVAPANRLEADVDSWFRRHLAPKSAAALRHAAAAARLHLRQAARELLPRAERLYLERLMATHDAAEGIRAFLEKRAPRWEDR